MTMSRRAALGGATAFAVAGATTRLALAGVAKRAIQASTRTPGRHAWSAQRFLEMLVHQDENHGKAYSAVIWVSGPDSAWHAVSSMNALAYRLANEDYKKRGYRLRRVSAYNTNGGVRYAGIWERVSGPEWHSRHGMTQTAFESAHTEFANKGFRMTHVDSRLGYSAIWERGNAGAQQILTAVPAAKFGRQVAALTAQGMRPLRVAGAAANGASCFTAIFEKSSANDWQAQTHMNPAQLNSATAALTAQGYRMVDASGHMLNGKPTFAGIWQKA